jgi:hypothetical protein
MSALMRFPSVFYFFSLCALRCPCVSVGSPGADVMGWGTPDGSVLWWSRGRGDWNPLGTSLALQAEGGRGARWPEDALLGTTVAMSREGDFYLAGAPNAVPAHTGAIYADFFTSMCDVCPPGYFCAGNSHPLPCSHGSECAGGATSDTPCPMGSFCPWGQPATLCAQDYWSNVTGLTEPGDKMSEGGCEKCRVGTQPVWTEGATSEEEGCTEWSDERTANNRAGSNDRRRKELQVHACV